jgi:hypothetical protein
MEKNTPYSDLKAAILVLEKEKAAKGQLLKEQVKASLDSIKPLNLLKNTFKNFTESPEVQNNLVDLAIAIGTGFISKKVISGAKTRSRVKQAGILVIDALNVYIARNPEIIRTVGNFIVNFFHRKKRAEEPEE